MSMRQAGAIAAMLVAGCGGSGGGPYTPSNPQLVTVDGGVCVNAALTYNTSQRLPLYAVCHVGADAEPCSSGTCGNASDLALVCVTAACGPMEVGALPCGPDEACLAPYGCSGLCGICAPLCGAGHPCPHAWTCVDTICEPIAWCSPP